MTTPRARVALLRTSPATVLEDFARLLVHAGFGQLQHDSARMTIQKDRHRPAPASNTTPWQLEGVLRALHASGIQRIHGSLPPQPIADLLYGPDLDGLTPLLHAYCVTDTPASASDHAMVQLQLARLSWQAIGDAQWLQPGMWSIIDGTTAHGPHGIEIRNLLLASSDPVAAHSIAAHLLGYDPLRDIAALHAAHTHGQGIADLQAIELVGDADAFQPAHASTRAPAIHPLRQRFEYYRWTHAEQREFESWLRNTGWGRLFQRYQ